LVVTVERTGGSFTPGTSAEANTLGEMPVWASILITVVAAVGSGSFGAGLAVWNDRHERYRDKMIDAADGFNVAAADALVKLRDAVGPVREANDPTLMGRVPFPG
jgi:hypothetical protein